MHFLDRGLLHAGKLHTQVFMTVGCRLSLRSFSVAIMNYLIFYFSIFLRIRLQSRNLLPSFMPSLWHWLWLWLLPWVMRVNKWGVWTSYYSGATEIRRLWRYQRSNQNPYIEEEQTTQWLLTWSLLFIFCSLFLLTLINVVLCIFIYFLPRDCLSILIYDFLPDIRNLIFCNQFD